LKSQERASTTARAFASWGRIVTQWGTRSSLTWAGLLWIAVILFALVSLDVDHLGLFLVPPFAATLTIVLLLPDVGVAQPYAVVVGSTVGSTIGTVVSFFGRGPLFAAIAALLALGIVTSIHAYHPPGVALALYPVLLHPGVWFPVEVVLPFALFAVSSASLCSRLFPTWPTYPRALRDPRRLPPGKKL